jgi:dipeptidase E
MKLLLTSGGVTNASILGALNGLLGKPISECAALCIPTASYGHPFGTPERAWRFVSGQKSMGPMVELGWKSIGLLELTALSSVGEARWGPWVRAADVLLVNGGDALYLAHWIRESGLLAMLPGLRDTVWVGLSAGSMALTPKVGDAFVERKPPMTGEDRALGLVEFSIFPHLDHPGFDENTMACAERWAAQIGGPAYAIDDQTAVQVVDGQATVITEGRWRYFDRGFSKDPQ